MRVDAPMQGTIVAVHVAPGDPVQANQALLVIESMKMEHVIAAEHAGVVERIGCEVGATVQEGDLLVALTEGVPASVADAKRGRRRRRGSRSGGPRRGGRAPRARLRRAAS